MATKRFTFRFTMPKINLVTGEKERSAMATINIAQMQDLSDTITFNESQVGKEFAGEYSRLNRDGEPYISKDGTVVCYFRNEGAVTKSVAL